MTRDLAPLVEELRSRLGGAAVTVGEGTVRVRPASAPVETRAAELGGILESAGRHGVRVSTAGPVPGGIYLCLDRWNRVVDLDREKLCLAVQPQAATAAVLERLAADGLGLAPDPCLTPRWSSGRETIGGYAATRRVLGVEAVWPDGRPVRLGGPLGGDQSALGLARLILGAGGALGLVTTVYLRLDYLAPVSAVLLAGFTETDEAWTALFSMAGAAGASRLECLDLSLVAPTHTCDHLHAFAGCGGLLVLEFGGNSLEEVEEAYVRAGAVCREAGARDVLAADNAAARQRARKVREHFLTCVGSGRPLHHLSGPGRRECLDRARDAGLAVPCCRLEEGTLCLTLGPERPGSRLGPLLDEWCRTGGPDDAVGAIVARLGRILDPLAVLSPSVIE